MNFFTGQKLPNSIRLQIDLRMKLTSLLIISTLFQVYASNTFGQETIVTLDVENVTVEKVLNKLESLTKYKFLYKDSDVDYQRRVSVNAKEEYIKNVLLKIFENTTTVFEVFEEQIILKQKPNNEQKEIVQITISGQVTDKDGIGLPGATILIKGTLRGTQTDIDGNYTILANEGDILSVSYVGFLTTEVTIGEGEEVLNIMLFEDPEQLQEIVVVGYGSTAKEDLTGSVGTVKMKNITNQAPTVNLDRALQGQVAGVYVSSATGQPGAASRVRIRGTTSLLGSNQPLYVIDGIPVVPNGNIPTGGSEGGSLGNELNQEGLSTPLGNINPNDIESISVLKDASAAAIYGSRAANGVIIIQTKSGSYGGTSTFNADFSMSIQEAVTLDVLDAAQYRQVWTTAVENSGLTDDFATGVLDGSYFGDADTNWEDEVSPNNPITTNFNLGVTGGSTRTRYAISIGVNNQNSVFENTGFDRYSFRLNLDTYLSDRLQVGSNINVSYTDQLTTDPTLMRVIYEYRPDLPVFNEEGDFSFSQFYITENPVARSQATNENRTLLFLGSFYTQLELAEGLFAKTLLGINRNGGFQESFYPNFTNNGGWDRRFGDGDGFAQESRSTFTSVLWQNTLNYVRSLDRHDINVVLGASFERENSSFTKTWGEGFTNPVLSNINSATVFTDGSSNKEATGLASYFGRVNYGYKDKYLATLSARVDGSSKFAMDNQYAFFPAAAVAWKVSNEPFLAGNQILSELKLRTSIGRTGQQDFEPYAWRALFRSSFYGGEPGVVLTQLGNDRLRWETTDQFDVGMEFSLFEGRLFGELSYYIKNTNDALFNIIPPGSSGTRLIVANVGDTQNRGIELQIGGDIISSQEFNWNVTFNITQNENKLTGISDDFKNDRGFLTGFGGGGLLREGSPIGLIFGYQAEGIFQTQEEIDALNEGSETGFYQDEETAPGDLKFKDITGPEGVPDGRITNLDQEIIGDTQPDYFGGFSSAWTYKGFTLAAFFTFSVGNDLEARSIAENQNFVRTFTSDNKFPDVLDAWTPENRDSQVPRSVYRDPNNNGRVSSHYVYDASFIRLSTLNLRYALPNALLSKTNFIKSGSVFVSAQNLFTITDYPGADPEASNLFNNDISAGRDNNRFPITRIFTTGVAIGF